MSSLEVPSDLISLTWGLDKSNLYTVLSETTQWLLNGLNEVRLFITESKELTERISTRITLYQCECLCVCVCKTKTIILNTSIWKFQTNTISHQWLYTKYLGNHYPPYSVLMVFSRLSHLYVVGLKNVTSPR